jgi:cell division protein FtsZ
MNIQIGPPELTDLKPRITVMGIGGAGCNAINNMIATSLEGVEFVVANTDAQSLAMSAAEHRIQLGVHLTEGLGAGARPEVGEAAAREAEDEIRAQIAGSHMVFIAAGMGGGTGTGAASVVAEIARDLGILTVGIVTKPFQFEGARRMRTAEAGIEALERAVDTLIVIPNQNLFRIANERTTFAEAFLLADQVLYSGIACIVDLIVKEGLINLDFADVRAVMKGMGSSMMGTGEGAGEDRALAAATEAISNPLLDNMTLSGAQGLLISIVGGSDLTLFEVDTAASLIRKEVSADANIIVGATTDPAIGDKIRVSIVASGMAGVSASQFQPFEHAVASAPVAAANSFDAGVGERSAPSNGRTPAVAGPPTPPPLAPTGDVDEKEADEFARALNQVMAETRKHGTDADEGDEVVAWRSPDGVVVEEGLGDMRRPAPEAALPERIKTVEASLPPMFEPAPPTEVRRGGQRMPEVSDFAPHAQREYYAKTAPEAGQAPADGARRGEPVRGGEPPRGAQPAGRAPLDQPRQKPQIDHEDDDGQTPPRGGFLRRFAIGGRG